MKLKNIYAGLFFLILTSTANLFADGIIENDSSRTSSGKTGGDIKQGYKSAALSDNDLLYYQYCGKDSDCMEVINGCCQCLQGDKYVSIAKDMLEAFRAKFQCLNVSCPKEDESIRCDDGVISCVSHRCTYLPAE